MGVEEGVLAELDSKKWAAVDEEWMVMEKPI